MSDPTNAKLIEQTRNMFNPDTHAIEHELADRLEAAIKERDAALAREKVAVEALEYVTKAAQNILSNREDETAMSLGLAAEEALATISDMKAGEK